MHLTYFFTQKMKISFKDFFSKCAQIRSFLRIWLRLLTKEIFDGILHFLCSVWFLRYVINIWKEIIILGDQIGFLQGYY